ncbi:MAG TPA: DUF1579 family protein [Phycisphaerales bacterium]|nr:DUF1579 family protein [Phycisphaerales bacterium]
MRSIRVLQLVSGSVLTLSAAATVFAQQEQPATRAAQPVRSTAQPLDRTSTEAQLLRRLEGIWNVQIAINPTLFQKQVQDDAKGGTPGTAWNDGTRPGSDTRPRPNSGPGTDGSNPNQPRQVNPTDRTNPDQRDDGIRDRSADANSNQNRDLAQPPRPSEISPESRGTPDAGQPGNRADNQDASRNQPTGQQGRTEMSNIPNAVTISGVAETKLILGGQILQQTVLVENMGQAMAKPSVQPGNRPGSGAQPIDPNSSEHDATNPGQPAPNDENRSRVPGAEHRDATMQPALGERGFTGVSFIAFDENSRTYSIAFMDSMHGEIRYDTGTFDAASNRIVFDGRDPGTGGGMNRPSSASPPSTPATGTPRADTRQTASGHDNVRVVLELLGNDQHRVTMYKVGGVQNIPELDRNASTPTPAATPGNRNQPAESSSGQPSTPSSTDARSFEKPGNIIYQATFTRTSGSDSQRIQDALKNSESKSRTTTPERR